MPKKGYKRTPEHQAKLSASILGKKNGKWRGGKIGYIGLHRYVHYNFGKADHCEQCGCTEKPPGKKQWFEWSNKTDKPIRARSNWQQLCVPCHRKRDYEKCGRPIWNRGLRYKLGKQKHKSNKPPWNKGLHYELGPRKN